MFDVFISYKRSDAEAVRVLTQTLREKGLQVWLNENRLSHRQGDWEKRIRQQRKDNASIAKGRGAPQVRIRWLIPDRDN